MSEEYAVDDEDDERGVLYVVKVCCGCRYGRRFPLCCWHKRRARAECDRGNEADKFPSSPIGCASEQLAPCIHKNSIAALNLILGLCPQPPRTTTI